MKKILIADQNFNNNQLLDMLKNKGYEVIINNLHRRLTEEETIRLGSSCVGIIAGGEKYNKDVIKELTVLQCVSRCGAGIDNIDVEEAKALAIDVRNTPEVPARAVAELTIGLILSLLRDIPHCDKNVRDGKWVKPMGNLLYGKTVGIYGMGRIGKIVAEIVLKCGAKVIGTDIYKNWHWATEHKIRHVDLQELLKESDILTIHISYSEQLKHIIGGKELASMKQGAYLVNTARGNIVDEKALYEALKTGHLAGVALDVYEKEPYKGKLAELDNVILTPHIGSYTIETRREMEKQAVANLLESLND
jgi:D-3-phosphoglycerate dehydrogenase